MPLPTEEERDCVVRSEHFEMRTQAVDVDIIDPTPKTAAHAHDFRPASYIATSVGRLTELNGTKGGIFRYQAGYDAGIRTKKQQSSTGDRGRAGPVLNA